MANARETPSKPTQPSRGRGKAGFSPLEIMGLATCFILPLLLPTIWSGQLQQWLPSRLKPFFPSTLETRPAQETPAEQSLLEKCHSHSYTTEIISLDPLVIYINNFTSSDEAEALVQLGEEDFEDSFISRARGGTQKVSGRTSQSAPLPMEHPLVSCILDRARTFLGTMLQPTEPFSIPQLVRYFPSQRYDLHTDFWPRHQIMNDGSGRLFNRPASFFVFLRDNCTRGETYFPSVDVLDKDTTSRGGGGLQGLFKGKVERGERDGNKQGVKFRPIQGNAVFWVNLDGEGVGDRRVVHAGLPVGEGEKIGMNLWPRKFFGWED